LKAVIIIVLFYFVIQSIDRAANLRAGLAEIERIIQRNDPLQLTAHKRQPGTRDQLLLMRIWQVVTETLEKCK